MTLAVKEGYNRAPVPAVAKASRRHGVFGGNPMFENLTDRLGSSLKSLAGQGALTEDNIRDTLREVRKALLEADVALPVVKEFVEQVKEKALGQEILQCLNPG